MKLSTAAILFLASGIGLSWVAQHSPVGGDGIASPLQSAAFTTQQRSGKAIEQNLDDQRRLSAYDTELNRLRYNTLQAAYAHSVIPCDPKNKMRFVQAVTDYAKAFVARTNCGLLSCSRDKLAAAAAAFDTAEDRKVQDAIRDAFSRGRVTAADFPVGRELTMFGVISVENFGNRCTSDSQPQVDDRRR